jgi:hypothetical protein
MSYLQAITADATDECLTQLVKDSLGDEWQSLNDLKQAQLVYQAHEHRQGLRDQVAISDLLAVQPLFSLPSNRRSPSPAYSSLHPDVAPLPVNPQPALQPTMLYAEAEESTPVLLDRLTFSPLFHSACTMAKYSRVLFSHMVTINDYTADKNPAIPPELSYSMVEDARHIAELAARAYHNRSMSWLQLIQARWLINCYQDVYHGVSPIMRTV